MINRGRPWVLFNACCQWESTCCSLNGSYCHMGLMVADQATYDDFSEVRTNFGEARVQPAVR